MNLIIVAALLAVTGAAKLDRTYLPPISAKTAGGSPGSLQPPLANSITGNGGLGGLPKGSYTNDFQGVIVDAAAPGTRASEEETGLGAPRISYGSTDSKVGVAAFTKQAAFRPSFNSALDVQTAETEAQSFQTQRKPEQRFNQRTGKPNIQGSASPTNEMSGEGFNQGSEANQATDEQFNQGFAQTGNEGDRPERPRAALDRAASTVRFDSNVGPESYSYSFETDNGISAEESGVATNGVQAQGGFSYTGDDGQVYTITYTADEGGFQPKGAHLPTPPPIPEEILRSLEQNARDEAAGLIDDGSYDAQKYNAGSDYTESGDSNGKYNHQSSFFGNRGEADATASGTFISQSNQAFARPGLSGNTNGFGSNIGQNVQSGSPGQDVDASGLFGSSFGLGSSNGQKGSQSTITQGQFGGNSGFLDSNKEGLQGQFNGNNGFGNKMPSQKVPFGQEPMQGQLESQSGFDNQVQTEPTAQGNFQSQFGQQQRPTQNSFGRPSGFTGTGSNQINSNGFASSSASVEQTNGFGNINAYLPPKGGLGQNRPQSGRPQSSVPFSINNNQQVDQTYNTNVQNEIVQPVAQQSFQGQVRPQESPVSSINKPNSNIRQPQTPSFSAPSSNGRQPSFGTTNIGSSVNGQTSNTLRPTNGNTIGFGQAIQSSNGFGNRNEYLPPKDNMNQNGRPSQIRPQKPNGAASQFPQQFTSDVQPTGTEEEPQTTFSTAPASISSSQNGFGQQLGANRKPETPNRKPSFQNGNRFPSSNVQNQFTSSSSSFGSQAPTSPPATELTTPLENSGPQYHGSSGSSKPASSISNTLPDVTPTQSQFGFNTGVLTSGVSSFGAKPSVQKPGTRPFGSGQNQFNQPQFGNKQPFAGSDAQFSPSTLRPSITQQPQGPDDSYYYNQPTKPFQTPQGSRFPTSQSNQFDRETQAPSYQNNQFSSQNSFQSTKNPRPSSLASVEPTFPTQSQSNGFSGITQASISPFPSETPTQSSPFSRPSQFGSRPSQSRPNQFGQSVTTQQSLGSQTTARPQRPTNGRQPAPQGQFGQQFNKDQSDEEVTESVPSQQYDGEIYEYKKPPQTLPPPHHEDQEEILQDSEQFGQKQPMSFGNQPSSQFSQSANLRPQFGQNKEDIKGSITYQSNQGNRPQPSRPQIGQQQNTFLAQKKQNPQLFGKQPRPFGSSNQFDSSGAQDKPQFGTSGDGFNSCCQTSKAPQGSQFIQNQSQFSTGFPSTQSFKPESTTNSFAGKGEEFGGPRKPPSFDPETGYHY